MFAWPTAEFKKAYKGEFSAWPRPVLEVELSVPLAINNWLLPSPPRSGRAEPLASTARARVPLRSHLQHHELHGPATQKGLSIDLFAPVQLSKQCRAVTAPGRHTALGGPTCSCVGQGRPTCPAVRSVLVFSVSQGDVFCGFNFLWICCQERKGKKVGENKAWRAQKLVQ